jgi:hypothetical protein
MNGDIFISISFKKKLSILYSYPLKFSLPISYSYPLKILGNERIMVNNGKNKNNSMKKII